MDAVKLVYFNARILQFVMIVKILNVSIVLINTNSILIYTDVSVIILVNYAI